MAKNIEYKYGTGRRKTAAARVFLKPLDTEQLGSDRGAIVPWRGRSSIAPEAPQRRG